MNLRDSTSAKQCRKIYNKIVKQQVAVSVHRYNNRVDINVKADPFSDSGRLGA